MKKEDFFRAIGEVSDKQIIESKELPSRLSWLRYAAAAACLVLIVTAALAWPGFHRHEIARDAISGNASADQGSNSLDGTPDGYNAPL